MPETPLTSRSLMTERQVADVFAVHPRTVRSWARRGELEPVRIGGTTRYRTEDVDALIHPHHDGPAAA